MIVKHIMSKKRYQHPRVFPTGSLYIQWITPITLLDSLSLKRPQPILHGFEDILSEKEVLAYASERYHVITTNADKMSAQDVVMFYRKRGDTRENPIKELKNGLNLKYLPTLDFTGNAFYFSIGVLAYNLFVLLKKFSKKVGNAIR